MATQFEYLLGQLLVAKVVEIISPEVLVVEISGKLFRVINQTGHVWRLNESIPLRVSAINPPEFQIHGHKRGFDRFA